MTAVRLPRALHPLAWWLWAAGLATAASSTSNPVLLLLIIAVAGFVVTARRSRAPWSRSYVVFLKLAVVVLVVRVGLYVLFGDAIGSHVLVRLPTVPLPRSWGVRVGGVLTGEGLVLALEDGLRLATVLVCIGAANALASPARLLKTLPGALYEAGVAVSVAISFAPQVVVALGRVRRARRLRGRRDRGLTAVRGMALPVLEDALERSVDLAAAMDARGFGRRGELSKRTRRTASVLTVAGLLGICAGTYGLLSTDAPALLGVPLLGAGAAVAIAGFAVGNRASGRSSYRPDRWLVPEWLTAASGVAVATTYLTSAHLHVTGIDPSAHPLATPAVSVGLLLGALVAVLPAWTAPPVPDSATRRPVAAAGRARAAGATS